LTRLRARGSPPFASDGRGRRTGEVGRSARTRGREEAALLNPVSLLSLRHTSPHPPPRAPLRRRHEGPRAEAPAPRIRLVVRTLPVGGGRTGVAGVRARERTRAKSAERATPLLSLLRSTLDTRARARRPRSAARLGARRVQCPYLLRWSHSRARSGRTRRRARSGARDFFLICVEEMCVGFFFVRARVSSGSRRWVREGRRTSRDEDAKEGGRS
jgi:hypothetical protein